MDKRKQTLDKYGISRKRYKELCGFCEQYPEWIEELKNLDNPLKAQKIDGMPHSNTGTTADETQAIAMKRMILSEKIDIIKKTAKQADAEFHDEIIRNVCYGQPHWYLCELSGMPISRESFYDRRRYFFFLLDKNRM